MTERLADIRARIEGVRQLGSVFNAMRGMAAARSQLARNQLVAVDVYAQTIAGSIGRALALTSSARLEAATPSGGAGLILLCAEQGFAGAFSERVLGFLTTQLADSEIFLIGSRGIDIAGQRSIEPVWASPGPSHSAAAPRLADRILQKLFERIAAKKIDSLDVTFTNWQAGRGFQIERRRLFPLDLGSFIGLDFRNGPLTNLPPERLLRDLASDYMHAQVCRAILHSFAAENQARMEVMAAAKRQADQMLNELRADERRIRQDEITDEIIELSAGERALLQRGQFGKSHFDRRYGIPLR